MPVNEIKEEFDDFLQEYLFAVHKVKENPKLDNDCKTETHISTFNCEEQLPPLMEIIKEEDSNFREDIQKYSSYPTGIREKRPVAYSFQDAPDSEEVLPQSVNSNRYKNAKKHYRGCHPFSIHLTSTWNT
ncbi:hypothetical protein AALO_G00092340 [Alosa alosa]|uniref:Uncharacterized protein n=1 Tax=Alosa alosa TaxID=278164 RepID=A0AAV6GT00_9TELE|nr:hypothetical protein AALO_G00092340 [Alosa alosa]